MSGRFCKPVHAAVHGRGQLVLVGDRLTSRPGLEVLVDPLIGVEIGCVAGQEEQAQPAAGTRDEITDRPGGVDRGAVDDQEDRPGDSPQQPPAKPMNAHRSIEPCHSR
ncbi:hypothetical protein OG339_40525 [Streptosporangium sp. NBC_01495]|nr:MULTISPECIES: hypothetical protein [unclassified Streptosporangium]